MTKSTVLPDDGASVAPRERRPLLVLEPARLPLKHAAHDAVGLAELERAISPVIPQLVRSLVDFTIARQNRRALEHGFVQPIQIAVLNRRRRAARAWLVALANGQNDAATRHAVATQWIPLLAGAGADFVASARAGRVLLEFVRGALTACVFDEPREKLLDQAKALHVLETTLAAHLAAVLDTARTAAK